MTGKTHMLGGTLTGLCWLGIAPPSNYTEMILMVGATTAGSLLPDIDHHSSKVTRANIFTRIIGTAVSGIFKHRQQVHTIYACIIFGIIGYILTITCGNLIIQLFNSMGINLNVGINGYAGYAIVVGIGFLLGSLNHLIWDTFNPQGILWLYPCKKRISICFIQTGSVFETVFYCINIALIAVVVYSLWTKGVFLC